MNKPPAFQFYPKDFVEGVSDMTQGEVGAYILLLCHQWEKGKITDDEDRRKMIAKGEVSEHVLSKFKSGKNKRMESERRKQTEYREKQRLNGMLGGRPEKRVGLGLGYSGLTQTKPKKSSSSSSSFASSSASTKITTKLPESDKSGVVKKGGKFTLEQLDLTERFHAALNGQWENDRQKWMGRIAREEGRVDRVLREVESAIKESRIKTTPARYAEQIWKEFL